eukprot:1494092-Rhodomonas_salina.2
MARLKGDRARKQIVEGKCMVRRDRGPEEPFWSRCGASLRRMEKWPSPVFLANMDGVGGGRGCGGGEREGR